MTPQPPPGDPAWADIRARYEAGQDSVQAIAASIGMSRISLSLHALKQGWKLRGKPKTQRTRKRAAAKPESTRETILRLKDMLQKRVSQLEAELKEIGTEVNAIANERGIKSLGVLVRTIEKVIDLERQEKHKRKQAVHDFKYFDDEQRRALAEKIERLEAEGHSPSADAEAGTGGGVGTEQSVALLGETGPATAAGGK